MSQYLDRISTWMADQFFDDNSPWHQFAVWVTYVVIPFIAFCLSCVAIVAILSGLQYFGFTSWWHGLLALYAYACSIAAAGYYLMGRNNPSKRG